MNFSRNRGELGSSILITVLKLVAGFFVMSLLIVFEAPLFSALLGASGADSVAASFVFGYIFIAILYVERMRWIQSRDRASFWRRRVVITVLVVTTIEVVGLAVIAALGGRL